MKSTTFELDKVFEENGHKGSDVLCCVFCRALGKQDRYFAARGDNDGGGLGTNDSLAIVGVREADTDRLVDEKHVGIRVPRFRVEDGSIGIFDSTRS